MTNLYKILKSHYNIIQVVIENFTSVNNNLAIVIKIYSHDFGNKILTFNNVSRINIISDYYTCSIKSSILIDDISSIQMEGVRYKISISEDAMTFYCYDILINNA